MVLHLDSPLDEETERIAADVVDAVCEVMRTLGRGLLERGYAAALAAELRLRRHVVEVEVHLPFEYKGLTITGGYRIDILVDGQVVIECKVVDELRKEHYAQVATYLRLSGRRLGILINFAALPLRTGIKRIIR